MNHNLDTLWSKVVLSIWGYRCCMCGCCYNLSAHHLIKRRYTALRYDYRNGVALCWACHSAVEDGKLQLVSGVGHEGLTPYMSFKALVEDNPDMLNLKTSLPEHEEACRLELKSILKSLGVK